MILRIDASSLSISDCTRRFKLMNIDGWTEKVPSFKAEWGSAFHIGVASWYKYRDRALAREDAVSYFEKSGCIVPPTDHRDDMFLQVALTQYFKEYANDDFTPLKAGDSVAVELPFAIPFMKIGDIEVLLCGVADAIGECGSHKVVIKDIKTTNRSYYQGVFDSYIQAIQFPIYSWVIRQLGICNYYPPVLIDGVFIQGGKCYLYRSPVHTYLDDVVDECIDWVKDRMRYLVDCYINDNWKPNFSKCKAEWGMCEFACACFVSKGYRQRVIQSNFRQRVYDPRSFNNSENSNT